LSALNPLSQPEVDLSSLPQLKSIQVRIGKGQVQKFKSINVNYRVCNEMREGNIRYKRRRKIKREINIPPIF